jgi:eukaryotic-like serine/threonine-protein kinase
LVAARARPARPARLDHRCPRVREGARLSRGPRSLPAPLADLEGFTAALTSAAVFPERFVYDEKGTVCDPAPDRGSSLAPGLPVLVDGPGGEIVVKGSLSRGGMGQIFVAEQTSLGREVALKIVREGKGSTIAKAELVVEARVAGQLEHPNIVPVHILGTDAGGEPLLVMKRIEGQTWRDMLAAGRELSRDLEILMDVCRALHFAHDRGVVHRDLKPANVMVGRFGEVYLLDWGIAVGCGERPLADLPHARDVTSMAGTPSYMAPEMVMPNGTLDHRADVYLAGAVLYELITGSAPHRRGNVKETLFAAHTAAEPSFGADVPEELAHICQRAMKRDPAERYQSAEELRLALVGFQSHAAARDLCTHAEARLAALETMPLDAEASEVQRAFTECRFGFSQAHLAWPDSRAAKEGLARALEVMARREISSGRYDSARLLVAELEHVPPDLAAELEALRDERAREKASLEELARFSHDQDRRFAERERAFLLSGSGAAWLAMMIALTFLERSGVYQAGPGLFSIFMASFAVSIAVTAVRYPAMRETSGSRAVLTTMLSSVGGLAVLHGIGWWYEVPRQPMLAFGHCLFAATSYALASQDARMWKPTLAITAIVPSVLIFPAHDLLVSGLGTFIALWTTARHWRASSSSRAPPADAPG